MSNHNHPVQFTLDSNRLKFKGKLRRGKVFLWIANEHGDPVSPVLKIDPLAVNQRQLVQTIAFFRRLADWLETFRR